MSYVIGVDIGTQSTKALICDADGHIVAQMSKAYHPDTPRPLWAEQHASVWLDATLESIVGSVERARANVPGFDAAQVKALCISSLYGGSGIPVDDHINPLHPCLIWMDRRAEAEVARVRHSIDPDRLAEITGNHVDSYYGYTKILWLKANRPEVWKKTRYWLPPNAFVIHALTGEIAVDHSSAGNIGGVYDLRKRCWSAEMLSELGIPPAMMPQRLVYSHEIVGGLTADVASRLGLAAATPVVAGGVDAAVATFAAGATRQGQHVAMIGTSMCWGHITPAVDPASKLVSMPHVFNGERDAYVFGGAIAAGASVTWFREQFCKADTDEAKYGARDVHELLNEAAAPLPAGADGLIFLPYLMGERSPIWDGRASGAFVGLSLYHTRAHAYRAVLEGVAFALRHNIEASDTALLDKDLIVVGGAAQSSLWLQIIADVTGRRVLTIAENVEAAMGAALLAALGAGLVSARRAADGWVRLAPSAEPREREQHIYNACFEVYRSLYPALKDGMHRLRAMTEVPHP
ncbi:MULTISPECIES: FGGY-family carbohydrate kinase [unclassified Chelatococcus]|uniref:FGGY-family carbohydrate kinase n=1 Tax=unclassified Chelatococcus TaxID=2638111 RepID=UPI001BD00F98|nr:MULTISPECIES: FGGY-family carbohydrate kinase [unclassified Chelatococcus]MBS7699562.1 FGGY-family carbohydrate kinase [Chelatococcus sp. YT9]MBX3560004.1 FGGY-family carbohydrate kinase [Chelatococcus sp.]